MVLCNNFILQQKSFCVKVFFLCKKSKTGTFEAFFSFFCELFRHIPQSFLVFF